jgi:hypothetical protein
MKGLFRGWIIFSLSVLLVSVAFTFYVRQAQAQGVTPPPTSTDNAIREAVQNAVTQNQQNVLGFLINNVEVSQIQYSNDGHTALVWLAQRDLETGDILGREPGYAVARNTSGILAQPDSWQITFQTAGFNLLTALPPELISDDLRLSFANQANVVTAPAQTFTGYKLPWSSALRIRITGSVGHFLDYHSCAEVSCRYAYDFWNPDAGNRMFPILASKGGILRAKRDSCANNDHNCTNYLVLEDNSTNPTTYQLYYHIANASVPSGLQIGSFIQQGQYIANVDNTGASTASHLHFMVYQTPTAANYFWGNSVRILFSDVPFNGGEPRTCSETIAYPSYGTQCSAGPDGVKGTGDDDYLTSGNVGTESPAGTLDVPSPWTTLTDKALTISGTASDKLGISRVEILLKKSTTWSTISSADFANGVYSKTIDLCAAQIPDGPFSLAVRIWDIAGNWAGQYTGIRQVFKNVPCGANTPPILACAPSADEVSLYSEANYAGICKKFAAGKYPDLALAPLGDNNTASIQVGANVNAVLFDQNSDLNLNIPKGRLETIINNDANLANNRIGAKTVSALWVETAVDMTNPGVLQPFLTFPGNRLDGDKNSAAQPNPANPKSSDSLVLTWTGGEGATLFTSKLEVNGAVFKTMSPQYTQTWDVGSLPAGQYTWTVTACIGTTTCTGMVSNSTSLTFTVDPGPLSTAGQIDAPTPTLDMEGGPGAWVATGLWRWVDVNRLQPDLAVKPTKAWIFNTGASFEDTTYRAGDLTSPPIRVSANGNYYLHFRFFSNTEGALYDNQTFASPYWDQRSVQVSINNGPFSSLSSVPSVAPLSDDIQNSGSYWPDGPIVNLGNLTTGQIVRVRFHFDSIDTYYNNFAGWAIDEVRLDTSGPDGSCGKDLANDTVATATPILLDGPATDSRICPQGDVDYYSFSGTGGTPLRIKIDAKSASIANPLDSFISLIDSSGKDVIAANDDSNPTNTDPQYRDSFIETILPSTGTFYVRVRSSWDYPGAGGQTYVYKLSVTTNTSNIPRPQVTITKPVNPGYLGRVPFIVEVSAADPNGSGVKKADFYWHNNDFVNSPWVLFASDTNGSDGWWGIFNPPADVTGGAFYMMATNNAGGTSGALMKDVALDQNIPVSQLNPLPAQTNSTAVQLTWTANDPLNLIDHFLIQYMFNNGAWTLWPTQPSGGQRSAWFVGKPGAYQFRMAAVNLSGNTESYPGGAEAATTTSGACTNDPYETNNTRSSATSLALSKTIQMVLCQNDSDWVSFQAVQGSEYVLMFPSQGGGSEVHVRVYDPSGANVVAEGQAAQAGQGLVVRWTATATGTFTIQITSSDPAVYGSDVRYGIYAGPPHLFFLPSMDR